MTNHNQTIDDVSERVRNELAKIEEGVVTGYTLADAIREGSAVSDQAYNWTEEGNVCALSAAEAAVRARRNIDR